VVFIFTIEMKRKRLLRFRQGIFEKDRRVNLYISTALPEGLLPIAMSGI
jgi:hypothetical protein